MSQERDAREAAYCAHLREMTTARQAAERQRQRTHLRPGDVEGRRAADQALRSELAHLAEQHQAWLREHVPADDLPSTRPTPGSRRSGPL